MAKRTPADPTAASYLRVSRPQNMCLLCNKPLNVEGKHASLIEVSGREEVIRKDFCPECWQRIGEGGYFSFWITQRTQAPTAKERRLAKAERNEALWRLFAALSATEAQQDLAPQLFFLAHLLLRYKVLNFVGITPEGRLRFIHPKLQEEFVIDDVDIEELDFVDIKNEVEQQALAYAPGEDEEPQEGSEQGAADSEDEEPEP